jgi:hypothetical protein
MSSDWTGRLETLWRGGAGAMCFESYFASSGGIFDRLNLVDMEVTYD